MKHINDAVERYETSDREWWQEMPFSEFVEVVDKLPIDDCERVMGELKLAIHSIQSQLEVGQSESLDWNRRARNAARALQQRRRALAEAITRQKNQRQAKNRQTRQEVVDVAEACLSRGDLEGAVRALIEWVRP